ncbi:hypothetical protein AB0R12_27965 [Streptomyces niveus]|uniref:hypothetical protein n=1 Tax=Streptomyces niveus TaxID=193462 RepID=UPI003433A427
MERPRKAFGFEMPAGNAARVQRLWSAVIGAILFHADRRGGRCGHVVTGAVATR